MPKKRGFTPEIAPSKAAYAAKTTEFFAMVPEPVNIAMMRNRLSESARMWEAVLLFVSEECRFHFVLEHMLCMVLLILVTRRNSVLGS